MQASGRRYAHKVIYSRGIASYINSSSFLSHHTLPTQSLALQYIISNQFFTSSCLGRRSMATKNATNGALHLQNELSKSRSPYVRGHMDNPVAWQMWGPEALELAKKHNRLVFISIGYAACHWCHVMERESFENEHIARILNNNFIPIKIDREERPDIDRIYMNYVQAKTGRGGWPMSVFITPDLQPVYGGTYWPGPESPSVTGGAHPGFLGILERIRSVWENQRENCLTQAKSVTEQLKEFAEEGSLNSARVSFDGGREAPELELLEDAFEHYEHKFDPTHGGFGSAPKFPTPSNLAFLLLLDQFPQTVRDVVGPNECAVAKSMAVETLRSMVRGGIHDQIGHGFARYSVTADWSLPHFEKMLYDQGQLLSVYLDAFLVTGDAEMLGAVYDIAKYLTTSPLAAPDGGFFSSEDADSLYRPTDREKREGAFYVWTQKELQQILGAREAEIVGKFYGVKEAGNVAPENDAHDELTGQNVLSIVTSPENLAKELDSTKDEVVSVLKDGRRKLLAHREKERPRPLLDDKIVVGWNGLAIGALARASSVLESIPGAELAKECREAAIKAVSFIKRELFDPGTGQLKRVYREGAGDTPAFADDYAFLISGLIELYEATFDDQYLEFANTLQKTQITLFHDPSRQGFFSTPPSQPLTLLRLKDGMDNAEPSTNGTSASNLHRLGALLNDPSYASLARSTIDAFSTELSQHPFLFCSMLSSVVAGRLGVRSVVITGWGEGVEAAIKKSRLRLKPNTVVSRLGGGEGGTRCEWLRGKNSLFEEIDPERAGVQVCEDGVCREELGAGDMERVLKGSDGESE